MPEKKIAVLGLKPMRIGPKTVAPNMASTCCRPTRIVCPQGRRSSGAMTPPVFTVQLGKYPRFSAVAILVSSFVLNKNDSCSVEQSSLYCPDKTTRFLKCKRECYA